MKHGAPTWHVVRELVRVGPVAAILYFGTSAAIDYYFGTEPLAEKLPREMVKAAIFGVLMGIIRGVSTFNKQKDQNRDVPDP